MRWLCCASMAGEEPPESHCECKVGRVATRRNLPRIDAELERRWVDDDPENRHSVRELAAYFNERVLAAILEEAGAPFTTPQVASVHDVLTSGDADEDERSEVRTQLREFGIDGDRVVADEFVSYQTVHNHLTGCLGLSAPAAAGDGSAGETGRDVLRGLQRRAEVVAEDVLRRESSPSLAGVTEVEVDATITIGCRRCGYSRSVNRFITDGGSCYCEDGEDAGDERASGGARATEGTPAAGEAGGSAPGGEPR